MTTEQVQVALEKLADLGRSWGTYCLNEQEHKPYTVVRFTAWDGETAAGICAQCLSDLLGAGERGEESRWT